MGYSLHKIGLARPALEHQRIARNIIINFYNEFGFSKYEAFQEGLADFNNPDGLVPDVKCFMNVDDNKVDIAIEITTNKQIKTYYFKVKWSHHTRI